MMNPTTVLSFPQKDPSVKDAFLTLEINRGQTGYPQRPVTVPRFLIGGGSGCDLRLGGPEIPPLHTVMIIGDGEVTVEAIAESPALQVNGRTVTSAVLHEGDTLGIGLFEFHVRLHESAILETAPAPSNPFETDLDCGGPVLPETAELSASELIEKLEEEQGLVESFEQTVNTGHDALLAAVRARQADKRNQVLETTNPALPSRHVIHGAHELRGPRITAPADGDEQFVHEFERVRRELEDFSLELEKRIERVTKREAHFDEAAKELVEAQNKLSAQLGTLLEQIETDRKESQPRANP